ncbi:MAG TPA: hypothetical protein VLF95_00830 [Vicinamibacteria bacterium]|nr:hypothetical protein [Vicinamibacteria bacterium]
MGPRGAAPLRTTWLSLSLWASLASAALAQAPQPPAPLPSPLPLFPADNWWNADVTAAPVDPNSAGFIGLIGGSASLHPDFGGDDGTPYGVYGMIYAVVPGTEPLEVVDFSGGYPSESDPGAPGRPPGYPIPVGARTEPRWIEGGLPGGGSSGDRHMLLVDRDRRILFELYATRWDGTLGRWKAGSGAVYMLDGNGRRPEGWTSADAAGLAILPGLVRYDEVFGPDPIRHAFRVTVAYTKGYVFPASHDASTSTSSNALPMGARLRLKAGKSIGAYPAPVQKIFQAMKTYGLIVADNGTNMYVSGAYDTRWDNDVLNPAFASLAASDFDVVERGWKPPVSVATGPTDFFTLTPCRLLDTRLAAGAYGGPAVPAGGERVVAAAGRCGIPAGAKAVSLNATAVTPAASGNLRFFPGDGTPPNASTLNFAAGQTRANNALVMMASSGSGTLALKNSSTANVHVVIDVNGYFE